MPAGSSKLAPRIESAKLKITYVCNYRCVMCSYWKSKGQGELSTGEWRDVITDLADMGCGKVHFSGGEPTARRDWLELVAHAAGLGIRVAMTTNGSLMTSADLDELFRLRVRSLSLSFDGPNSRIHDAIRGRRGAFRDNVALAEEILRMNGKARRRLRLRVNVVVQAKNYRKVPDMIRLGHRLGAEDVILMPVDAKSAYAEPGAALSEGREPLRLSPAQVTEYNRSIRPVVRLLRRELGFRTNRESWDIFGGDSDASARGEYAAGFYRDHVCFIPWLHTFVGARGDVYLCCMTHNNIEPLGNVRKDSIRDIFLGKKYDATRSSFLRNRLAICGRCDQYLAENRAWAREFGIQDPSKSVGSSPSPGTPVRPGAPGSSRRSKADRSEGVKEES